MSRRSFGGIYRAFQYGAPPHGGMAAGIDRIVMLLAALAACAGGPEEPLREDHAVPDEPAGAEDLLMNAPSLANHEAVLTRQPHFIRVDA
jgi:aspartyl-tRNA synthetase